MKDVALDSDACFRALRARDSRFDGMFYVGVTSTGIYCRPICPARTPGPDRAARSSRRGRGRARRVPRVPAVPARARARPRRGRRGRLTSCARAAKRIDAGSLDDHSVEQLADRLGVTARHLRRSIEARARRVADRARAVAPARAREPAARRRDAADHGGRARGRVREPAPVQRAVPCALRPAADGAARRRGRRGVTGWCSGAARDAAELGSTTGRRSRGSSCSGSSRRARSPGSSGSTVTRTGARSRSATRSGWIEVRPRPRCARCGSGSRAR